MHGRRLGRLLIPLLLALQPACAGPLSPAPLFRMSADAELTVSFTARPAAAREVQALVADVHTLVVSVVASDGREPRQEVPAASLVAGTGSVTFQDLPAGPVTVKARALDADSRVIGAASATATLTAGVGTAVQLALQLDHEYLQDGPYATTPAQLEAAVTLRDGLLHGATADLPSWGTMVHTYSSPDLTGLLIRPDKRGGAWVSSRLSGMEYVDPSGVLRVMYGGFGTVGLVTDSQNQILHGDYGLIGRASAAGEWLDEVLLGNRSINYDGLAIDAQDELWAAYHDELVHVSASGQILGRSPVGGPTTRLVHDPVTDHFWGHQDHVVVRISRSGSVQRFDDVTLPGDAPVGLAVDEEGHAWVAQYYGSRVSKVAPDGTVLGHFRLPDPVGGVVCDGAGHVYVATQRAVYRLTLQGVPDAAHRILDPLATEPIVYTTYQPMAIDSVGRVWMLQPEVFAVRVIEP